MFEIQGQTITEMISAAKIAERVAELGRTITEDYADAGRNLVLVAVMKGSIVFLSDLCRRVDLPCTLDMIGIASYGDETRSSGVVQITADLSRPIEGRDVVIVEDIIDTGLTVAYLLDNLKTRQPRSLKVCTLLHKPARTIVKVPIHYLGFTIPDEFVIGYGLDYAQRYRNLPFIGTLSGVGGE